MGISVESNEEFENEYISDTFLDLYSNELDNAEAEIDSGNYLIHEEVENLFAKRRKV